MIYRKTSVNPLLGKYTSTDINLWLVYITWSSERTGWVRLFGSWYGIHWKHKNNALMFSERCGKKKSVVVFNYRFRILKPQIFKYKGF